MNVFFIGGARSGKSRCAQTWVETQSQKKWFYLATAEAGDAEMARRIARHRYDRGPAWQLVEEPIYLASALSHLDQSDHVILLDCLTLWLANTYLLPEFQNLRTDFLTQLTHMSADVVLVSNEVGSGIIPLGESTRQFVDEAGWLNQAVADIADQVNHVVAGISVPIKRAP